MLRIALFKFIEYLKFLDEILLFSFLCIKLASLKADSDATEDAGMMQYLRTAKT